MAPALLALLPQLMGMLQKKKEQPAQGPGYNQAPPAPEDAQEHDNRMAVMSKLQMPKSEKVGDDLNDSEPDMDQDDMWNKMGGGGGGY